DQNQRQDSHAFASGNTPVRRLQSPHPLGNRQSGIALPATGPSSVHAPSGPGRGSLAFQPVLHDPPVSLRLYVRTLVVELPGRTPARSGRVVLLWCSYVFARTVRRQQRLPESPRLREQSVLDPLD